MIRLQNNIWIYILRYWKKNNNSAILFCNKYSGSNPIKVTATVVLEISIFLARQETRAILVDIGQLAMAQDFGIRVIDLEAAQQGYQGCFLRWGARVGRAPLFV